MVNVRTETLDQTNASIVKNDVRMGWEVDAISAKTNSTSGYEAERQKQKKRIHTVNPFCFVVFRPQSLLDFLESRVMKRKSINHCEERSEIELPPSNL